MQTASFNTTLNKTSITLFNRWGNSALKIDPMHAQTIRLYEAAKEMRGVTGQSAVARLLNTSPQTLSNWERRGMSKAGLLLAQERIGCSATWIETGRGEMDVGAAPISKTCDEHAALLAAWDLLLPEEQSALLDDINRRSAHNLAVMEAFSGKPAEPPPATVTERPTYMVERRRPGAIYFGYPGPDRRQKKKDGQQ